MVNGVLKRETFPLIYLIDREAKPIAKEIRKSFERREFRVKILETLDAFKGAALNCLPDFIIMEYDQKDMPGKDFIKKIRAILELISEKTQPPASHVPILVYATSGVESYYGKTYYTGQCLEAGADRYIGEPRDGEMVISALRQFIVEKKSEKKEEEDEKERLRKMLSTDIDRDKGYL
jgi:DNA-binding response OmpR family regulator